MSTLSDILINNRVAPTPELLAELESFVADQVAAVKGQNKTQGRAKLLSFEMFKVVMDLRFKDGMSLNKISNRLLLGSGIEMTGDAVRSLTIGETYKDFHVQLKNETK